MNERETVLNVRMSCGSCAARIERALRAVDGVAEVQVHLGEKQAVVRHDASAPTAALLDALRQAGYDASPVPLRRV